jgi:hypothetical protein
MKGCEHFYNGQQAKDAALKRILLLSAAAWQGSARGMMRLNKVVTILMVVVAMASAQGQTTQPVPAKTPAKHAKPKRESATEKQLRELKEQMAAQQAQIDELKAQIAAKDQTVTASRQSAEQAQQQAAAASAAAASANAAAQQSSSQADALQSTVTNIKTTDAALAQTVAADQAKTQKEIESPAAIHYKGITITPVAFFAFENVYRERSLNSDVNSPFNSIPLPSANEGHVSELNFSARQSRLGALVQGNAGPYKLSGYWESDFLGAGTTSNDNQSNSYVMRQRQIWGQAALASGFTLTAGQMWSLVTETGKSTDNRTEKLPNTVDASYVVGFSWTRQPAVRFQQQWGDTKTGAFTAAMSLENAQITNFTATSATAGAVPANFFFAGAGANGGLYNAYNGTYANNVAPDVVVKGVYDNAHTHLELGGIARFLRDYYFPITGTGAAGAAASYTYATNYVSNTKSAGGIFGSARVSPDKFIDVAVQAMAGTGVGRYGSSQLADATLRPDGTLEPLKNYHGLLSIETHPTPKLDVYAYYGGEYAQRTVYTTAQGYFEGYGARNLNDAGCYALPANPGSSTGGSDTAVNCASPTRYLQEAMLGFTYRFVNSPKFGRLQYTVNYQYIQRNLWSGVATATTPTGPRALDNMVLTGLRYYIP